jgi:hypothetical protein
MTLGMNVQVLLSHVETKFATLHPWTAVGELLEIKTQV